jgi:hypothetical protein
MLIPEPSLVSSFGIGAAAAYSVGMFMWAMLSLRRAGDAADRAHATRALLIGALWIVLVSLAALAGLLERLELRPPPYFFVMAGTLSLALWAGCSRIGKRIAETVPLAVLVGVQAFRLPLELAMHQAASEGVMPVQLSFSGYNFDIVTGASALIVALLLHLKRAPLALVAAWNLLGLACLLVIVIIALLASPVLRAFGEGPSNVNYFVAYFPFVLLPAACVVFALAGHIVVLRRLRLEHSTRAALQG